MIRRSLLIFGLLSATLASAQTTVATASPAPDVPSKEAPAAAIAVAVVPTGISQRCAAGLETKAACSFHWRPAMLESVRFLAIQHALNTPTYRGTLKGPFFGDWFRSVRAYRFSRWSDDDPFIVDYVGHPMMGAVVGRIQIQNDPRGVSLQFSKSKPYWQSRAKALAFATVYTAQWELGPASETSIGNIGSFQYYSKSAKHLTNGTGTVDLVMTPLGGTALLVAEDILDRYAITRLERVSNRKLWLLSLSVLNPTRSTANMLRWHMPWYRDTRVVGTSR